MPNIDTLSHSKYICNELETAYKAKPFAERSYNVTRTIFNASLYYLSAAPRISLSDHPDCSRPDIKPVTWKENSEGLFVVIHGLAGSPAFSSLVYREQIEKAHPGKYEIQTPYVRKLGNCSLEEAADPILSMVRDYIEKNPGKPVNLIGTSNGGRISGYIESKLRDTDVNIRVTGIAGVFFGSLSMNILDKTRIGSLLFKKEVVKDLKTGSTRAMDVITDMQKPVTTGSRSFKFYATANDLNIPNFSSCFPRIKDATYELITGQDHISISTAICPQVLLESYEWMDSLPK
jgi:predicted alpha/beta-fold hydrolase